MLVHNKLPAPHGINSVSCCRQKFNVRHVLSGVRESQSASPLCSPCCTHCRQQCQHAARQQASLELCHIPGWLCKGLPPSATAEYRAWAHLQQRSLSGSIQVSSCSIQAGSHSLREPAGNGPQRSISLGLPLVKQLAGIKQHGTCRQCSMQTAGQSCWGLEACMEHSIQLAPHRAPAAGDLKPCLTCSCKVASMQILQQAL